jgi:hypothetical protein
MYAKFLNNLWQGRQTQSRRIACQQPKAVPAGYNHMLLPMAEQYVIERTKSRRQQLLSCLRERAFGNRSDKLCLIGKATEEIVQFPLQTSCHATKQAGYEGGEGERASAREISGIGPMGGDKTIRFERSPDFGHQRGMEVAKSFSCILLINNNFIDNILPQNRLNLTALGTSPMPLS